jgi:poly(3-hydroxybutyrate) depolymerase
MTAFGAPRRASGAALAERMVESSLASWAATLEGLTGYWAGAVERRATPLDLVTDAARFWAAVMRRRPPQWASPHHVVLETPLARVRDFSQGSRTWVVPTLVLPPQAGHDSCIVDYSPEQSQMRTIREAGLKRAWSLDWVAANRQTRTASIEDYLGVVERAVLEVGPPVNLIGDCQGGWLAAIYAALRPEHINTLTVAGAPIDFHAGGGVIAEWVAFLWGLGQMSFYRTVVGVAGGVLPGRGMLAGFVGIKPENEIAKHLQLLATLHDRAEVERYREFEDWFKRTQDIPGPFYLWIVEHLFRRNSLIRGELEIGGERVDLGRISVPLQLLAGENDHITPPDQVFALESAVSTPAAEIAKDVTSGGHLGLFMSRAALRNHWPPLLARVSEHSR